MCIVCLRAVHRLVYTSPSKLWTYLYHGVYVVKNASPIDFTTEEIYVPAGENNHQYGRHNVKIMYIFDNIQIL